MTRTNSKPANPFLRLSENVLDALQTVVGEAQWTVFRASSIVALDDLPPATKGVGMVLMRAALDGLMPGHGCAIDVELEADEPHAYMVPRLSGLEQRAHEAGVRFGTQVVYQGDTFEFSPFTGEPPAYKRQAVPPEELTGTKAELFGGTQRYEPVREYVAWLQIGDDWHVDRITADAMEGLRLLSANPSHPSWRRSYDRVARGRVLRNLLAGLPADALCASLADTAPIEAAS